MAQANVLNIVRQYADVVSSAFGEAKFFLFGSYAKGSQRQDSDIDIAVVLKDYNNRFDMQFELMKLRRNIDFRIEPHPFRERDFEQTDPLVNEILKYGQEITY